MIPRAGDVARYDSSDRPLTSSLSCRTIPVVLRTPKVAAIARNRARNRALSSLAALERDRVTFEASGRWALRFAV